MESASFRFSFDGPGGSLPIDDDDKLTRKLAMLIEAECLGATVSQAAQKYGYSRPRYYQVKRAYLDGGSEALVTKKTGPKRNYVRTDEVETEIIRHCFLDDEASSEVITQKMRQAGYAVSDRSVRRTLAERGLQKKTLQIQAKRQQTEDRHPLHQEPD